MRRPKSTSPRADGVVPCADRGGSPAAWVLRLSLVLAGAALGLAFGSVSAQADTLGGTLSTTTGAVSDTVAGATAGPGKAALTTMHRTTRSVRPAARSVRPIRQVTPPVRAAVRSIHTPVHRATAAPVRTVRSASEHRVRHLTRTVKQVRPLVHRTVTTVASVPRRALPSIPLPTVPLPALVPREVVTPNLPAVPAPLPVVLPPTAGPLAPAPAVPDPAPAIGRTDRGQERAVSAAPVDGVRTLVTTTVRIAAAALPQVRPSAVTAAAAAGLTVAVGVALGHGTASANAGSSSSGGPGAAVTPIGWRRLVRPARPLLARSVLGALTDRVRQPGFSPD